MKVQYANVLEELVDMFDEIPTDNIGNSFVAVFKRELTYSLLDVLVRHDFTYGDVCEVVSALKVDVIDQVESEEEIKLVKRIAEKYCTFIYLGVSSTFDFSSMSKGNIKNTLISIVSQMDITINE